MQTRPIVRGLLQVISFWTLHAATLYLWIQGLGWLTGKTTGSISLFFLVLGILGIGIFVIGGLMSWLIARRMGSGAVYRPAGWLGLFGTFLITVFTLYSGITSLLVQPFVQGG